MCQATFRFYAELNDFLSFQHDRDIVYPVARRASVKDAIEALGVPHTEVDLILVNGLSVDFGYPLQDGDRVSVYPTFENIDITPLVRLRPQPLREPRFVLDVHLGKLATYLRLLGFDCLYTNNAHDGDLARTSNQDNRTLLTRDRGLLKHSVVSHGYFVRNIEPVAQTIEVVRRFDLFDAVQPFRRCLRCNGLVTAVPKATVLDQLLPKTRLYFDEFHRCETCGRVYWRGSHYERMQRIVDTVQAARPAGG